MHFEDAAAGDISRERQQRPLVEGADAIPVVRLHRGLAGWLFDTMDQQLFNLARKPAITELLTAHGGPPPSSGTVAEQAGFATMIFMIGWALGGIFFGVLGDRIGRAKTMMLTVLCYSAFTGLSALSVGVRDFAFYRFLTGLGVGGQFAVGVRSGRRGHVGPGAGRSRWGGSSRSRPAAICSRPSRASSWECSKRPESSPARGG